MTQTATVPPTVPPTRWRPVIATDGPAVDQAAAHRAAVDLLTALGLDLTAEHLAETPRRMVDALVEMTSGPAFELTSFPNDDEYDELVLVEDIPVQSLCEHHMLPFIGVAHVGYLPGERILGLSKLARVVERFARDLQITSALRGAIRDDPETRQEFLALTARTSHDR